MKVEPGHNTIDAQCIVLAHDNGTCVASEFLRVRPGLYLCVGGGAARGLTSRRARSGPSGPSVAAEGLRNVASRQVSAAPRAGVRCWFMYAGAGRSSRTGPAPPWMCAPLDTGPDHGEDGPATPLNGAKHRAGPAGAAPLTCRAAPGPPPPMPGAPAPRRAGARQRGPPTPRKCVLRRVGPRPRESGCWEDMVGRRSGCWADRPGCLWPRPVNG